MRPENNIRNLVQIEQILNQELICVGEILNEEQQTLER